MILRGNGAISFALRPGDGDVEMVQFFCGPSAVPDK
jgi:hypothetical protein